MKIHISLKIVPNYVKKKKKISTQRGENMTFAVIGHVDTEIDL
jgi:hypothetical protein